MNFKLQLAFPPRLAFYLTQSLRRFQLVDELKFVGITSQLVQKLTALFAIVVITSCSKPLRYVSEAELIGQWTASDKAKTVKLTISDDHTYLNQQFANAPVAVADVVSQNGMFTLLPESGTWSRSGDNEFELTAKSGIVIEISVLKVDDQSIKLRIGSSEVSDFARVSSP